MNKLAWGLLITTSSLFGQLDGPPILSDPPIGVGIGHPGDLTQGSQLPTHDIRYGNWIIGNGGDTLPVAVKKAQAKAAFIVEKLRMDALSEQFPLETRKWIIENRELMAWDIRNTQHQWNMEAKPTCAWTLTPDPSTDIIPTAHVVQFSYPTCRDSLKSFAGLSELLIHESVHHFGIPDEEFANTIAFMVMDAWRSGGLEWVSMTQTNAPTDRARHSAVWDGESMLIFGGYQQTYSSDINLNSLHAFNPETNSWNQLPDAPNARNTHQAIWTDHGMIVWGGYEGADDTWEWKYDGLLYDKESQSWSKIPNPFNWQENDSNSFFHSLCSDTLS